MSTAPAASTPQPGERQQYLSVKLETLDDLPGREVDRASARAHDPHVLTGRGPFSKRGELRLVRCRHLALAVDHDGVTSS